MKFTQAQAEAVSSAIERALRATGHPDLPAGKINFALLIQGADGEVCTIDNVAPGVEATRSVSS